ncbi:MAG: lipoprotein [Gammaproteobacteria bacterium]|nr:lipoprotein [Gammaproteobacteria bacterium]
MRWLACVLLSFLVATCGQKGPLTLPEEEALHGSAASGDSRDRAMAWVVRGTRERAPTLERRSVAGQSFGSGRRA